ncbi:MULTISPECIES: hypothetical protein [unclassified Saccharothrix]|uniref:hypothetical protein n=1 Tax=unclassified Saccharothrix TaxID=2593673 RepID=UPI00307D605B
MVWTDDPISVRSRSAMANGLVIDGTALGIDQVVAVATRPAVAYAALPHASRMVPPT